MAAVFVALVIFVAVVVSLRDAGPVSSATPTPRAASALAAELEQCRTVTPEQVAALEHCRRIWTENRLLFLAPPRPAKTENRVTPHAVEPKQGEAQ